jgi:HPt (histidine-containing phosphotransfer) domain-containing protein
MSAVALDAARLAQLRVFNEEELRQIIADVIDAVAAQLKRLDDAFAARDLVNAAQAAHRGRNEALLVGARELCEAFTSVEEAARAGDMSRARDAASAARELWPATRSAIDRVFSSEAHVRADGTRPSAL